MPAMLRWLKKLVTKEHSKKKQSQHKRSNIENVPQQNGNSTSAVENSFINGISSSSLSIESDDLNRSDSITSNLIDGIAALQLTNGHAVEIPKQSDESLVIDPLSCAQRNAIEIESAVESDISNESAVDSDDDSFYTNLFADTKPKPTYVSAPTDTFPFDNDSDSEADVLHTVTFYMDDDQQPMAEFSDSTYRIGHLDLTTEEHSYLKMISEAPIQLDFNPSNVVMHHNRLCIKRIEDQQKSSVSSNANHLWFAVLNLARIQFSVNEPFLAKYQNEIYFVGRKLCEEYMLLLLHTNKNPGTPIRLNKSRIVVDTLTRTLDVMDSISLDRQSKVCIISGPNSIPQTNSRDDSQYRRYIINNSTCEILEVDPALLHSSEHDHCMEIYAESDFPSIGFEAEYETVANENENENDNLDEEESDFEDDGPLEMMALKPYAVPEEIKMINRSEKLSKKEVNAKFNHIFAEDQVRTKKKQYIQAYSTMIHLEEDEQARYLATFNEDNIQITYHMDRQFHFAVPNLELAGAIEENFVDRFILKPKLENVKRKGKRDIWGQVVRVKDKKIYIEIFPESFNEVRNSHKGQSYEILFTVNRVVFQLQHLVLEFIKTEKLFPKLIRNRQYLKTDTAAVPSGTANPTLDREGTMFNQLNDEQQCAVKNIISKKDKMPFILFGPPGTGKTRTLVAAIEQIIRTTNQNVLVCAMSNAACDEIAERLTHVLEEKQMYRFYAKSFKNEKINGRIARNSNYSREGIFYPSLKFLYQFRVFICTLASAGCLTRARIDERWRPDHFGYVIIDEAASAHECMCLIPIAGLCTSRKNIHAQIVLAGDPKQLDAVTKSEKAKALGYSTSWLEHLCNTNLYSRNTTTGKFNERYITQLVKNYRSHPHILSVPNELFYENKLEPCAAKSQINWYIDSRFLPSKNFPVIFKSVQGSCKRSTEYSWYNDEEIDEVIKVIKQLMPRSSQKGLRKISQTDIGIVTPYRKQRNCLSQKLRRLNFDEITIGTAEVFQGKEKPVMIISTVRSNGQLGFVAEPRRLNVVITRAKCLVVIIGDPHTLKADKNWLRVMQYCMQNNSFLQSNKKFSFK